MAVFCIIHELKNKFKSYTSFFEAVQSTGVYWRTTETVSFIESDKNAEVIRDILSTYMDSGDKIMVIEVKRHWGAKGYKQNEYDWLQEVLK